MSNLLKMNGQWTGDYTGATGGKIIVNIDERESVYQGVAYLLPGDFKTFPATIAFFRTSDKDTSKFHFRTASILAIHPDSLVGVPWKSVKDRFPDIVGFSKYADVPGTLDEEFLRLSWKSDLDAAGECVLPRSAAGKPSELDAKKMTWPEYIEHVASLKGRRYLFRGQDGLWRLRTSFHRTGRADLNRFLAEDIPNLVKHLSARTRHFFKLDVPDELGAFFNLVQHHGYPTPLLDWTYSPYVAAFLAYRRAPRGNVKRPEATEMVRVHVLNQERWRNDYQQLMLLLFPGPHVSVAEFISIENERMIPQQAASTLSSVDDIETYVRSKETEDKKYLSAIDLPVVERDRVMEDLSYMGITAGSLFPGIDGACEELRERNFS
jgi:FRG domain